MKQRVKFALADVRYVQSAIEMLLNRVTAHPQRTQQSESRQKSTDTPNKSPASRPNALTPNPKKHSPVPPESTHASPNAKLNKKDSVKVETFGSPPALKSIFGLETIEEVKEEPKKAWGTSREDERIEESKEEFSHKSIMMMWKERAGMAQLKAPPGKTQQKKEEAKGKSKEESKMSLSPGRKINEKQPKSPKSPKKRRQPEPVDDFIGANTVILPQKVGSSHSPIRKNAIPLRTDQDFLKHRYSYGSPVTQKEQELKQKYKVLDLRLQRLKEQVTVRPSPTFRSEGNLVELRNDKKLALQNYYRYSPLTKLLRINDKLKRDYEITLTSQDRKRREKSITTEDGKPKWIN